MLSHRHFNIASKYLKIACFNFEEDEPIYYFHVLTSGRLCFLFDVGLCVLMKY